MPYNYVSMRLFVIISDKNLLYSRLSEVHCRLLRQRKDPKSLVKHGNNIDKCHDK